MKETWIIQCNMYTPEKTYHNFKGEVSISSLLDDNGKFHFDSENEAKEFLIKHTKCDDREPQINPITIMEIKKVYVFN